MSKRQKRNLKRIILSLILFLIIFIIDKIIHLDSLINNYGWIIPFALYLVVYIIIGYDVIKKAFINIIHGHIFDENFLMLLATVGAFSLAIYRGVRGLEVEGFDEACAVLIFYQVGEFFQNYAVSKSRKSIKELMDIRPDSANVKRNNDILTVFPDEVKIDEVIVVNPGEKIPLDGVIIKGRTSLDTKALTGESIPSDVEEGNDVLSGCVNLTSQIEIRVVKEFYDSTVSKILDLVENASSQKSKTENFITKFAKYYTPIVITLAALLAVVPSIITKNPSEWIYRALNFLVVSCPCALVISIPLSFFAGLGAASKKGILIKGSNYLELLNKANVFVFDKTGTLTKGNFKVVKITPEDKRDEILRLASIAESGSNHPIANSIKEVIPYVELSYYALTNVSGKGIIAKGIMTIHCGNEKLMEENNISYIKENDVGTIVYISKNKEYIGSILIKDEIKEESYEVIDCLNKQGIKTIMLTGDNDEVAKDVYLKLGLTEYKSHLLPQNKVYELDEIIKRKNKNDVVCFVGDGINDAPVLMKSDIGIAMGGVGSDAAIEAADVVLMKDDLTGILEAKKIAKKTLKIVYENIVFALGIKILILILSAFGIVNMWIAIFGDVGVAVIAILNAMRANLK